MFVSPGPGNIYPESQVVQGGSSGCPHWVPVRPGPVPQMVTHCYYSVTDAKSIQIEPSPSSATNGFISRADLQM